MGILLFVACSVFAVTLPLTSSDPVFIRRNEASRVLRIHKRANTFLEEIKSGNLERECYEETCSFEEAREIFKAQEKTMEFWFHYKDLNPCKVNPCRNGGLCQQYHYTHVCLCPPRFSGKLCDTERFECWYRNGGCLQYCQDEVEDVICSCAEGYTLDENGKSCSGSVLFPCGLTKSSTRSLQDDHPHSFQGDSALSFPDRPTPPNKDTSTRSPLDDSSHHLNDSSTLSPEPDFMASLQGNTSSHKHVSINFLTDNCTLSLKNTSKCFLQGNSTNSDPDVTSPPFKNNSTRSPGEPFTIPQQDNHTSSPGETFTILQQDNYTSILADNATRLLSNNITHLTPNNTMQAHFQNLSADFQIAQGEATFTDGFIPKGSLDEDESFLESLENNHTRIIGGVRCYLGNCPWQVLIRNYRGRDFCGGSLISSRWVVSASHCFEDVNPHHVTIGDFDKFRRDQDEQKIAVLKVFLHPHYNANYYDNDIALLYLRSAVQFNDYAIPICLPNPSLARLLLQEGETGLVSGWGSTQYMGPSSRFLLKVNLPVVSQKKCMQSTQQVITGSMFCAGYSMEAQDSCKGDSGGPFAMSFRNTWYLMGVVSWGEGCAAEGKYGVYTRVSDYIQWIKETVEENNKIEESISTGK